MSSLKSWSTPRTSRQDLTPRLPAEEVDVDEDTEGDDVSDAGGDEPMTMTEVANPTPRIHGDEVELDLDEALRTGRTVGEAPEEE